MTDTLKPFPDNRENIINSLFTVHNVVEFKDNLPDVVYEIVIPYVKKQFAREYIPGKFSEYHDSVKDKWYVRIRGYYTQVSKFGRVDNDVPFFLDAGQLATMEFSGYGFFTVFRDSPRKHKDIDKLTDKDGCMIRYRRKEVVDKHSNRSLARAWDVLAIEPVRYNEYTAHAKENEEDYVRKNIF